MTVNNSYRTIYRGTGSFCLTINNNISNAMMSPIFNVAYKNSNILEGCPFIAVSSKMIFAFN